MNILCRIAALLVLCIFLTGCTTDTDPDEHTSVDTTRTTIEQQSGSTEAPTDVQADTNESETFISTIASSSIPEDDATETVLDPVASEDLLGSRLHPAVAGDMIRLEGSLEDGEAFSFTITPGQPVTGDEAMAELKEQNDYNDVFRGGSPFIIPVSITVETWPDSPADPLYIYDRNFASHFADYTRFEPRDTFVHNAKIAGEISEGDTLAGVLIYTAPLWNDHFYIVFDDSVWWEYPITDADVLTGETRPQESVNELPSPPPSDDSIGTQDDPLTAGTHIGLSLETFYGEADLTISIDSILRGKEARARAAEENTYNLFNDDQDAVFIDVTVTVQRLEQPNDAPLLIYAEEHFLPFDSRFASYEDGIPLSYDNELFHYFYEGDKRTDTVAMMIPRDETAYILFYDRIWIEIPAE